MLVKKPRGTVDIVNEYNDDFQYVQNKFENLSYLYNYKKIETPIFEEYKLFSRNENDASDMVNKEMYVFSDKGDRLLALRPEGTAGVVRAIIEEKLLDKLPKPLKYFYFSKMFRYERPQSGRQRQFHQYGIELIDNDEIYNEVQCIMLAIDLLKSININNFILKINYIGNFESRSKWIDQLKKYFNLHENNLTQDSIDRIEKNPLRILDDKVDGEKDFVKNAPKIDEFLSTEEKSEIDKLKLLLKENNIHFEEDKNLVRGLDYYTGIVFEIISKSEKLKGQSTLVGGGRYSKLFKELGYSKDVNCFGFAAGIERILIALKDENNIDTKASLDVYIANISDNKNYSLNLLSLLRNNMISADCNFSLKKIDKHFKYAESLNAKNIIIIGDNEINNNEVVVKNQLNLKQENVKISNLVNHLLNRN